MSDLDALLSVKPEHVAGILEEFTPVNCTTSTAGLNLRFYYVRFQDGLPRIDNFVGQLLNFITAYCLKREKLRNITVSRVRQLYMEAKGKFTQPKNNRTGEPGELIVYFLLEGCLKVPKIISKMSLKTNNQMHIHGADGVHLGVEGSYLILYFGESKLYSVHTAAVSDALASIKEFVSPTNPKTYQTQKDFEINVLTGEIDIPEGDLRNRVLDALDPYSAARDNLKYAYACFIGFDIDDLATKCESAKFSAIYQKKAESCYDSVVDKISTDDILKSLSWQFFFIPFSSVDEFRARFITGLKE